VTAAKPPIHLDPVNADLPDRFTAGLTPDQAADAHRAYTLLTDAYTPAVALAWFTGRNPQLADDAPLTAIREGRAADVLTAARAYLQGTAA
jgi:hypothetical protein